MQPELDRGPPLCPVDVRPGRGCTAPLAADSHTAFADGLVRASDFRFRVRRAFVCNSHFEAHAQLSYLNLSLRLTHPDVHWLRLGAYLAWRRGGGRVCHQTSSWATLSPCTPCQPLARSLTTFSCPSRPSPHAFLLLRNPPYSIYSQARAPPPRRRSSQVPVARECRLLSERTKRATRWS